MKYNGVFPRRTQLVTFETEYNAKVVLLCKTHLARYQNFSLLAYTCNSQDRAPTATLPSTWGTDILVTLEDDAAVLLNHSRWRL